MNNKTIKILARTAWAVCLLTAMVLGIKNLREPDTWWELTTGQWILTHRAFLHQDVFSYTFAGTAWINVKWLFEVIIKWLNQWGGPEFTLVLQSVANVLILVFVLKVYKLLQRNVLQKSSSWPSPSILFSVLLLLFVCSFRFIGRPELSSHVLTAVFLFIILGYYYRPSRNIFWLIPLQIIWTNLHEAYGTGMIMAALATGAYWLQYFVEQKVMMVAVANPKNKKGSSAPTQLSKMKQPWMLTLCTIAVLLAPAVHPDGLAMITHPLKIFADAGHNKLYTEFSSFTDPLYWKKEGYINMVLFVLGCLFFFLKTPFSKGIKWYWRPIKNYGLAYIGMFFIFFYLSISAYRSIPFFVITVVPLFALGLDLVWEAAINRYNSLSNKSLSVLVYGALLALGIAFYISIPTGFFYKYFGEGRDRYGLQTNRFMHPIGAAAYIKSHHLSGNAFSDYYVSSYLLWKLQPDFKTFIDLRDLDIYPSDFFNQVNLLAVEPELIRKMDEVAHFKYAVVYRREFTALHEYLATQPNWKAVYADPIAAIYLKIDSTNPANVALFANAPKLVPFSEPEKAPNSALAQTVSKIFWPWYHPEKEEAVDIDLIAADYYKSIGQYEAALAEAKKSAQNNIDNGQGEDMTGNIYLKLLSEDTSQAKRQAWLGLAGDAFGRALEDNKKDDAACVGLGLVSYNTGDASAAEIWLKKAVQYNPDNFLAYKSLASIQNALAKDDPSHRDRYAENRLKYLKKAYSLNDDQLIRFYLGMAYGQSGDCDNCLKYLDSNTLRYPGLPEADRKLAQQLVARCGGK